YRVKTKSGEWKWLQDRGKVVERKSDGTPLRASGTILDITEKKSLEEKILQTQKLESLGILAGGIAHDFNNLLMGILGNADMALLDIPNSNPGREYLEDIIGASQRAAELCNQMLAYAGKGRFMLQPIHLPELVREMAHLLEISISKKIKIDYDIQDELPCMVGDPSQVRQIIMNLITNASESVDAPIGRIRLKTGVRHCNREFLKDCYLAIDLEEGDYIFCEVCDSGMGMDESTLEKIFDPFFTTKFNGRGLGLAAVLGIVRSHHGMIRVESLLGRGTNFTVFFPISSEVTAPPSVPVQDDSKWKGEGAVLLIDDEEAIRSIGQKILGKKGYVPLLAEDGDVGVELFLEHQDVIQVVILDLTMPRMSGEETFQKLVEIDSQVRVILSSGFSESEATSKFVGQGLAGFIQKPYRPSMLVEKIRRVLEDSAATQTS
ncbi:MAG: response regulator, partial [Candidatus Omnitrophica bacterium]|nr:response regulator [Candidatus Omnitrophota bacterium]